MPLGIQSTSCSRSVGGPCLLRLLARRRCTAVTTVATSTKRRVATWTERPRKLQASLSGLPAKPCTRASSPPLRYTILVKSFSLVTSRGWSAVSVSGHPVTTDAAARLAAPATGQTTRPAPFARSKEADHALETDRRAMPVPKLPNIGTIYMRAPMCFLVREKGKNLYREIRLRLEQLVGGFLRANANPRIAFSLVENLLMHHEAHPHFYNEVLGLEETYQNWFTINQLQLWMLFARLRKEPAHKNLFTLAEFTVTEYFGFADRRLYFEHKVKSTRRANKVLQDCVQQHHGCMLAYDESFVRGDAVLAMALWRNVFLGKQDATPRQLALMVQHVRRQLFLYDRTPIEYFIDSGTPPLLVPLTRLVNVADVDSAPLKEPILFAEKFDELPPEVLQNER